MELNRLRILLVDVNYIIGHLTHISVNHELIYQLRLERTILQGIDKSLSRYERIAHTNVYVNLRMTVSREIQTENLINVTSINVTYS